MLRRKPPGKLLKCAHMVEREFRVHARAGRVRVSPRRRALALCEDECVAGSVFFLMSHVEGRIFWDPALPDSTREERAGIYDAMNAALARLHAIDVEAAGLADYGKPGNYFARQWQRWSEQYRASETSEIVEMNRLIDWLGANMPPDDGRVALVHGDYRIDNMIFDANARACSRCWTGSFRRSAIPSPISPISACSGGCRTYRATGASATSTARRLGIPTEAEYVAAILPARRRWRRCRTGRS